MVFVNLGSHAAVPMHHLALLQAADAAALQQMSASTVFCSSLCAPNPCMSEPSASMHSPVPPSPTSTSLKAGTPAGVCWPVGSKHGMASQQEVPNLFSASGRSTQPGVRQAELCTCDPHTWKGHCAGLLVTDQNNDPVATRRAAKLRLRLVTTSKALWSRAV